MSKKIIKRVVDLLSIVAIAYVLFIGYFVFFDKPTAPIEIASLYTRMGYSFLALIITLLLRLFLNKKV